MTARASISKTKAQLRQWAQTKKPELDLNDISKHVSQHLICWETFVFAKHILTYMAFGPEIDLSNLALLNDKIFYITRTHRKPGPYLSIHRLSTELERHPFGYYQPTKDAPTVAPETIDLVLVPGLAFDNHGARLGYGMGYYDRLLSHMPQALKIGITAEELLLPELPQEAFDIKMTHLATEKGIRNLSERP